MKLSNNKKFQIQGNNSILDKLNKMFSSDVKSKTKSKIVFKLENLEIKNFDSYEIINSYDGGMWSTYICKDKNGKKYYLISEPPIDEIGKAIYVKIMKFLYVSLPSDFKDKQSTRLFMKKKIIEISRKLKIDQYTIPIIDTLLYYMIRDSLGYGIIDVLMQDPYLEDIVEESFNQPVGVIHKKFGEYGILDTNIQFNSLENCNAFVQKLVQRTGKSMTAASPYIDSMTKEGHRIAATYGKEVSLPGPNFTIRKFSEKPYTITMLLEMGTINPMIAAYVWVLLDSKAFVLVIGSTAAGKTTTIGALSSLLNPQMKITTIEDTPELRIGHTHWQRLITRKSSSLLSDKYEVTMDDLVKLSLRSRPDYVVVGEVRGAEISSLFQAVATGHGGLTSFHASDASAALVRMESPPMNVHLSGQMLISVILRQNRLVDPDGKIVRRITEVTEVIPERNKIKLKKVLGWDPTSMQFYPDDVRELVKNSERLKEIATINGWTEEDLITQLVMRISYLKRMSQNNIKEFADVTQELDKFYYDPLERYLSLLGTKSIGELSLEKISSRRLSDLNQ